MAAAYQRVGLVLCITGDSSVSVRVLHEDEYQTLRTALTPPARALVLHTVGHTSGAAAYQLMLKWMCRQADTQDVADAQHFLCRHAVAIFQLCRCHCRMLGLPSRPQRSRAAAPNALPLHHDYLESIRYLSLLLPAAKRAKTDKDN